VCIIENRAHSVDQSGAAKGAVLIRTPNIEAKGTRASKRLNAAGFLCATAHLRRDSLYDPHMTWRDDLIHGVLAIAGSFGVAALVVWGTAALRWTVGL
jgi:hypothetical protein